MQIINRLSPCIPLMDLTIANDFNWFNHLAFKSIFWSKFKKKTGKVLEQQYRLFAKTLASSRYLLYVNCDSLKYVLANDVEVIESSKYYCRISYMSNIVKSLIKWLLISIKFLIIFFFLNSFASWFSIPYQIKLSKVNALINKYLLITIAMA